MSDQEHRPLSEEGPLSPGFEMRYGTLRGEKGERGEQGAQGKASTRLPLPQARAIIFLLLLNLLLIGAGFFGLIHYVRAGNSDRCTSLEQVVAIPVPRPVAGNPSREFDARFEAIEQRRARELGCRP
jgi:hypothetical protein